MAAASGAVSLRQRTINPQTVDDNVLGFARFTIMREVASLLNSMTVSVGKPMAFFTSPSLVSYVKAQHVACLSCRV